MNDYRPDFYEVLATLPQPADDPSSRAQTRQVLHDYFRAVDAHDLEALRPLMTDDVFVEIPFNESGRTEDGFFRVYRGIDEVMNFWAAAFAAEGKSDGLLATEITESPDGSVVFVEARARLTMASGREYRNRYVMRIEVRGGKIAGTREYYNPITSAYAFQRPIAGHLAVDALPDHR